MRKKNRFLRFNRVDGAPEGGASQEEQHEEPQVQEAPKQEEPKEPKEPLTPEKVEEVEDSKVGSYPANTPVAEMTPDQQAAYYKHHLYLERKAAKKAADDARQSQMTAQEKALEAAKIEGKKEALKELQTELVYSKIDVVGQGLNDAQLAQLKSGINVNAFIDASGMPNEDKIRTFLEPFQGGVKVSGRNFGPASKTSNHGTSIAEEMARFSKKPE